MRYLLVLGSLVVLTLAFAAACGDDDDGEATLTPAAEGSPTARATPAGDTPTPPPLTTTTVGVELREFVVLLDKARARPGTLVFQIENNGEMSHEFKVVRSDLPRAELPRDGTRGVDETQVDVVAAAEPISPGATSELTVDVTAGNYVLICNLFADGVSHYLSGMYTGFEVTPTAPVFDTPAPFPDGASAETREPSPAASP